MRYPTGTPSDGDVPVFRSSDGLTHWEAQAGGGISTDIQNQLNALALGQGIPLAVEPQYYNTGGQGSRNSIISVTNSVGALLVGDANVLVNGTIDNSCALNAGSGVLNKWIRFEFPAAVIITEIMLPASSGSGFWQWRGSQDETNWAALTDPFELKTPSGTGTGAGDWSDASTVSNACVMPIDNPFAWKFYEMKGISGSGDSIYLVEIFFKILGLE